MRTFVLLLALVGVAWAAPPKRAVPLKVEGGETVVVVKGFPCTVTAPEGAHVYIWSVPDGVRASKSPAGNVLTVTAAPKGAHRVGVISVTIDFDAKRVVEDSGEVTLNVGDVPAPPGPTPVDPLARTLRYAYESCQDKDSKGVGKTQRAAELSALYAGSGPLVAKAKTAGELQALLADARKLLMPDDAVLPLRKAIADHLKGVLPGKDSDPPGDPARLAGVFDSLSAAIKEATK